MKSVWLFLSIVIGVLSSALGHAYEGGSSEDVQIAMFGSREQDSLALVAIYQKTGGDNWREKSGWLTNQPIDRWDGVIVDRGRVVEIDLSANYLIGSLPAELGNLNNLEVLWLSYNQLSGSLPAELGNLRNLRLLSLSYNQLSGSLPAELGNLSRLELLDITHTQLSGVIPIEFRKLNNLQKVYLEYNQLSGPLPAEIGNLSKLREINLSNNELSGSLPTELGNVSKLEELKLANNKLSGSIPAELGNLYVLRLLDLSGNELSGSLPVELGNLSNLYQFKLNNNKLTGSIPTEFGYLSSLRQLDLSGNQLSGVIAPEIGNLRALQFMDLSGNNITGAIPKEFKNLPLSTFNITHCDFDSGLENIRWMSGINMHIAYNRFDFSDLQGAPPNPYLWTYHPQDSVGVEKQFLVPLGRNIWYALEMPDAEGNVYLWYKDAKALTDQQARNLIIKDLTIDDYGEYECRITNPRFPELTLYSRKVLIGSDVSSDVSPGMYQNVERVYPNPASDFVNVDFGGGAFLSAKIEVVNFLGQVVSAHSFAFSLSGEVVSSRVDVSNFLPGLYLVRIQGDRTTRVVPLTIVR